LAVRLRRIPSSNLSGVATDDPVDIEVGREVSCFDQQPIFFAGGDRKTDRFEKGVGGKTKLRPLGEDVGGEDSFTPS